MARHVNAILGDPPIPGLRGRSDPRETGEAHGSAARDQRPKIAGRRVTPKRIA
jgi:hypothetical protein